MPWAACAEPETRPMVMNIHVKAKPKITQSPTATSESSTEPAGRKPIARPMAAVTTMPHVTSAVSPSARPVASAARGMGSERNRSTTPRWTSSATPAAARHPGEQHAGDDESRDHEVDVAHAVGLADRAAEHVAEDEQEHRPLDRWRRPAAAGCGRTR